MELFISVHDRLDYLRISLKSLLASIIGTLPNIIITDDGSTVPEIEGELYKFQKLYPGLCIINTEKECKSIPYGKLDPISRTLGTPEYSEEFFLISDSDMIYKRGWIENLIYLYAQTGAELVTGFNTEINKHKTIEEKTHYRIKENIGGCNLLVDTAFYLKHPFKEEKEWDFRMCERAKLVIASTPSMVDHIGVEGYWARKDYHDNAEDFNDKI